MRSSRKYIPTHARIHYSFSSFGNKKGEIRAIAAKKAEDVDEKKNEVSAESGEAMLSNKRKSSRTGSSDRS